MDPATDNARLRAELKTARRVNLELRARAEAAEEVARRLKRDLELLKRRLGTPSSERLVDPNQLILPIAADQVADDDEADDGHDEPHDDERSRRKRRRSGKTPRRRDISEMDELPTKTHTSTVEDRPCPCCGEVMEVIGEEVSWRLERIPAYLLRHKNIQFKYACPHHASAGVLTAPPPVPYALPKAMCGNGLLAKVVIDKYADHLPLYRQAERFEREGVDLARSTLCGWMMALGELLRPIRHQLALQVRAGSWLRADATGLPVLDRKVKGRAHLGHLWAWGNYELVVFDYTPDKKGETVAELFEGFEGTVLFDGASDFNLVEKQPGVERAGCWAHARRKFYDAMATDQRRALQALGTIRELFLAERIVMSAPVDERLELRDEMCRPLLEGFRQWLEELGPALVPRSPLYKAVQYVNNQWDRLVLFLERPQIACHNNDTERDLRRPVKGKHNYLFCGSPRGADVAAVFYSLIGTCLLQGIDPRAYLVEILGRLDEPAVQLTPPAIREEWEGAAEERQG